jgi:hypothetical protein
MLAVLTRNFIGQAVQISPSTMLNAWNFHTWTSVFLFKAHHITPDVVGQTVPRVTRCCLYRREVATVSEIPSDVWGHGKGEMAGITKAPQPAALNMPQSVLHGFLKRENGTNTIP